MARRCLHEEHDRSNHITICHRFAEGSSECRAPREALDFCIDRHEFPNEAGAKPAVMTSWHQAARACEARGKRLCQEREWTAACEGPAETPFPYGWARSADQCNHDHAWVSPRLSALHSASRAERDAEVSRLGRSVPSGSRPSCASGFGVLDLTGNVDEWVRADRERKAERGRWAALKGGAWGHVRNACRPVTTSHAPEWRYYFVGFRCCADPRRGAP